VRAICPSSGRGRDGRLSQQRTDCTLCQLDERRADRSGFLVAVSRRVPRYPNGRVDSQSSSLQHTVPLVLCRASTCACAQIEASGSRRRQEDLAAYHRSPYLSARHDAIYLCCYAGILLIAILVCPVTLTASSMPAPDRWKCRSGGEIGRLLIYPDGRRPPLAPLP